MSRLRGRLGRCFERCFGWYLDCCFMGCFLLRGRYLNYILRQCGNRGRSRTSCSALVDQSVEKDNGFSGGLLLALKARFEDWLGRDCCGSLELYNRFSSSSSLSTVKTSVIIVLSALILSPKSLSHLTDAIASFSILAGLY